MKKIFQITIILLLLLCTISAVSADNLENSSNMDKSNSDISSYEKINLEDTEDLNSNMPIREISDKDSKYFHDENFKDNSFSNYEKDNNTSKNIKINKTNNNKTNSNSNITRNSNNAPTVIVHEVSEIRNNTLNITMSSNVEGTIYYTRNGSTPTKNSRVYTNGQVLNIYVKTQIKAIVITKTGITKVITKTTQNELIKGAIPNPGQGYCYHRDRSNTLTRLTRKIHELYKIRLR